MNPIDPVPELPMIPAGNAELDPVAEAELGISKNHAKVGSARPSSLLYSFGVGSIIDLPHFSIMPAGLDDWDRIYNRRKPIQVIDEPRLLKVVQKFCGREVLELRPFPRQPQTSANSREGDDLGVPARVFPQWLQCGSCSFLGPSTRFKYFNERPHRPDMAEFTHPSCPRLKNKKGAQAVPARYLLACPDGHLDEFPYSLWVHRGQPCPTMPHPDLQLRDTNIGQGSNAQVKCVACGKSRGMGEAQGDKGMLKLPQCRGRHPHLDSFDRKCNNGTRMMMMGASNLWFTVIQSIVVMPRTKDEAKAHLSSTLLRILGAELVEHAANPAMLKMALRGNCDLEGVTDADLLAAAAEASAQPGSEADQLADGPGWDPIELRVPEWNYLQNPIGFAKQENSSGLMVSEKVMDPSLPKEISRVIAVDRMKKVNAVLGFTRIDEMDRVGDHGSRLVKLTRNKKPTWVPATEDRGEGVFLQLDETAVARWEAAVHQTPLWEQMRAAHRRNFERRFSLTAEKVDADQRLPAPRYWLVHTLAHLLIREMAMSCGYGAASLSERLYAWPATEERPPAAGVLICTTASDSEGTLGGLVALSESERMAGLVRSALLRAGRCSSDPICASRTPQDPEDFLHGAACHCCSFASETSCERSNRFLDRRFLVSLPSNAGERIPAFFGDYYGG